MIGYDIYHHEMMMDEIEFQTDGPEEGTPAIQPGRCMTE
jgi:hypothetical protein